MNEINFPENFSLEGFVESFVAEAISILQGGEKINVDEFYDSLFLKVAEKCRVNVKCVKYLHHAFHWSFFDSEFFEYFQLLDREHGDYVRIKRKPCNEEIEKLGRKILDEHRDYLEARIKG